MYFSFVRKASLFSGDRSPCMLKSGTGIQAREAMSAIPRKFGRGTRLTHNWRAWYSLFLLSLLLLVGLAGYSAAKAAVIGNSRASATAPGLRFAIADFDGDLRPDLATILAGHSISGASNYSIQLQLSAAGRQSIQVDAPAGGLLIEARDVNGDLAVDLVLTTILLKQPVAVLLNDGHGRFSIAAPAAVPGAFGKSQTDWISVLNLPTDSIGVPPQSGASTHPRKDELLRDCSPSALARPPTPGFPVSPFLFSQSGRAPPSELSHL
jgi:hypothetical protein